MPAIREYVYRRIDVETYEEFKRAHSSGIILDFISFPQTELGKLTRDAKADVTGGRQALLIWAYLATYERNPETDDRYAVMELFRLGFLHHDPEALYVLAIFYMTGCGVRFAPDVACGLFHQAASAGLGTAWYQLGVCYFHGIGTAQSCEQARDCFQRARCVGDADADGYIAMIDLLSHQDEKSLTGAFQALVAAQECGSSLAASILSEIRAQQRSGNCASEIFLAHYLSEVFYRRGTGF